MTDPLIWIWLQQKLGFASKYAFDAVHHPEGVRFFYNSPEDVLLRSLSWPGKLVERLRDHSLEKAESIYIRCLALGYQILTPDSALYPLGLRRIADPPLVLYCCGDINAIAADVPIAIVGTRHTTPKYFTVAQDLGFRLAGAGATVVSGCAAGIDSAAHLGAILSGGRTIGILGCGLDFRYNMSGEDMRCAMTEHSILISEYPPGTDAHPYHFPQRNRLISGISIAVTVVHSGRRGGALITARLALEQGRDLFVYYDDQNLETLAGIHSLGCSDVTLIISPDEILRPFQARFGRYIDFTGTEKPLSSIAGTYPADVTDRVIREIADRVKKRRKEQAQAPSALPCEFSPVSDISFPELSPSDILPDNVSPDISKQSQLSLNIAKESCQTDAVDYSLNDTGTGSSTPVWKISAIYAPAEPAPAADDAPAEKTPHSPEIPQEVNSAPLPEETTPPVGIRTEAVSGTQKLILSARHIGLSEEQISALLAQLEKDQQSAGSQSPFSPSSSETQQPESIPEEDILPPDLSDEARAIYKILQSHSDTLDNIAVLSGLTISLAAESMLELELYGLVCSRPGGIYSVSDYFFQ